MTAPRKRPRLSIRIWFAIAGVVAFVSTVALAIIVIGTLADAREPWVVARDAADLIEAGADHWDDPAWQAAVTDDLTADDVDFILVAGDEELYRSDSTANGGAARMPGREGAFHVLEVEGSQPPLSAYISAPTADTGAPRVLVFVAAILLVSSTATAWVLGRLVIGPLHATGRAARQVAGGDLDVALPRSRVAEVDEVNRAFDAMALELRRSLEAQATVEQERRLFIGAIAHDLRTPLFSLRGYLEGIRDGVADTPERRARYIHVANEKAYTLERLVGDLFDYTRLGYLDQRPDRHPLDLSVILRQVAEDHQREAEQRGVTLHHASATITCTIDADGHLLSRAIGNLIDNALRHTPTGGDIELRCGADDSGTWFTVADTGSGIRPEDLPHLFQPLYRGGTSQRSSGSGLGLTIAQRILVAHGGALHAENRAAGGAIFTGSIPPPER